MWHCKTCNENFDEPGTWNANTKKFLCPNCLSPLSHESAEGPSDLQRVEYQISKVDIA